MRDKGGDNELTEILTIRVSLSDIELLDELTARHTYAKRGSVARDALRRGLEAMKAEGKEVRRTKR